MIYNEIGATKISHAEFLGAFLAGDQRVFREMKPKQASKLIYQT